MDENEIEMWTNDEESPVIIEMSIDWPIWLETSPPMPIDTTTMVMDAYDNDDFSIHEETTTTSRTPIGLTVSVASTNTDYSNFLPFASEGDEIQYNEDVAHPPSVVTTTHHPQTLFMPFESKGEIVTTAHHLYEPFPFCVGNSAQEASYPEDEPSFVTDVTPTNRSTNSSQRSNKSVSHPLPARPLTSYNFFFIHERERILEQLQKVKERYGTLVNIVDGTDDTTAESIRYYSDTTVWSIKNVALQEALLHKQWDRDRTMKRKHRKSHGDITFNELTKRISNAWHALPTNAKEFFSLIAFQDTHRFIRESSSRRV
jgi:hypothetical protein